MEDLGTKKISDQIIEKYHIVMLDYDKVKPGENFRHFGEKNAAIQDHIESLKQDISDRGIVEPLKVVAQGSQNDPNTTYTIIDGECRYKACAESKIQLPCIVMEEKDAATWKICANILRRDFNCVELSNALAEYKKQYGKDISYEALAKIFGHRLSWARDILSLQNLPDAIKREELEKPTLPMRDLRNYATQACRDKPDEAIKSYRNRKAGENVKIKKENKEDFEPKTPNLDFSSRGTVEERRSGSIVAHFNDFFDYLNNIEVLYPKEKEETEKEALRKGSKTEEQKEADKLKTYTDLSESSERCRKDIETANSKLQELSELINEVVQKLDTAKVQLAKNKEEFDRKKISLETRGNNKPPVIKQ